MVYGNDYPLYKVTYRSGREDWALIKGRSGSAVRTAGTKQDLVPEARRIAKNQNAVLKIEDISGGVSEKNSYL